MDSFWKWILHLPIIVYAVNCTDKLVRLAFGQCREFWMQKKSCAENKQTKQRSHLALKKEREGGGSTSSVGCWKFSWKSPKGLCKEDATMNSLLGLFVKLCAALSAFRIEGWKDRLMDRWAVEDVLWCKIVSNWTHLRYTPTYICTKKREDGYIGWF